MFTMKIVDSDAFLDMPLSTQALYFHLNMRADDDGFVNNPRKIARMIGASDDDLKLLLAKDTDVQASIFTRIKAAVKAGDWEKTSEYQRAMKNAMNELKNKYKTYYDNQI